MRPGVQETMTDVPNSTSRSEVMPEPSLGARVVDEVRYHAHRFTRRFQHSPRHYVELAGFIAMIGACVALMVQIR